MLRQREGVRVTPLYSEQVLLAVPPSHALARSKKAVELAQLRDEAFISIPHPQRGGFDYSEGDTFEVISAQSTQPGAKPVALDATQIDTRTAPNPDQGFSRDRQTSLAFPNLRVGTQIRYTVREHHAAKPLMTQFHYVLKFGASPARRDRFKARFTAERPIQWRSDMFEGFSVTPSQNGKSLDVVQKAPTYLNYINEASNAALLRIPRIEVGSALERQAYFGAFAQRYNQILGANLPPQGAAAVVAVRALSPANHPGSGSDR